MQLECDKLEHIIAELKRYLPYADGQQYYRDKQRIAELEAELRCMKNSNPCTT